MADIVLYHYSGENERVVKTSDLTDATTYSGNFRDRVDLHDPVFTVGADVSASYNYCSVTVGNETRYYFARVENVRTGLSLIRCNLDVLMTFNVLDVPVIPYRSASAYNRYIIDASQPVDVRTEHFNLLFQGGGDLDYNNMTLVAGIVGTGGTPTNN